MYSSTGDDQVPSGSFSILETVQIMHNKMTRQRGGPTVESTTLPQTVEEDALRQERRQASLAKLRNQKASLEDVEAAVLHSTEDGVDDSFEMFPSRLRIKTDVPPVKGPMMSGLHEAVLKRRAMLDAKSPSSRQLSSRNLEVAKSTGAPERGLSKGESFRAAPTRAPMVKGESYRAGPSNSNSVPNRRGMMLGQASQKSIMLTGPHHSGAQDDEPVAPKQGIARQQSMLGKLFNKRAGGDVLASPRPTGSPTKQRSQKSAFNLFTLNEDT